MKEGVHRKTPSVSSTALSWPNKRPEKPDTQVSRLSIKTLRHYI